MKRVIRKRVIVPALAAMVAVSAFGITEASAGPAPEKYRQTVLVSKSGSYFKWKTRTCTNYGYKTTCTAWKYRTDYISG